MPLVVAAVAALSVLVFAFVAFMRGQGRLTHRAAQAEAAYHLALSGVDVALAAVDARMQAGGALEAARDGLPAALEASRFELDSRGDRSALGLLVAGLDPGLDARIAVKVAFKGWRSLYPVGFRSPAGAIADPVEKSGFIEVLSSATCGGVSREVSCHSAARVVRPAVPVLPRFTLFVKRPPEPGGLSLTEIEKRTAYPVAGGRLAPSATHDALVLWNAAGPFTAASLGEGWLDRAGWVFLGAPADAKWQFDLAYGNEEFGQGHELTRQAMWVTGDREAAPAPPDAERLVQRTGFYTGLRAEGPQFAALPRDPGRERAASLHIFGSVERPSPTVVLGRAFRRSLVWSWLGTRAHDHVTPVPYAPGASDPRAMSHAVVEPYARSFDHVQQNAANPTAPEAFDPPYVLVGLPKLTRRLEPLDPDPGRARTFLYAADANAHAKLFSAEHRPVFAGDLGELAPVDLLLPERTTHVFTTADFRRWTAGGHLRVRGVMALDPAEPDLTLDRPLEIDEGGVLVVRGSIDITAPLIARPAARPLTLVALEGRIRVRAPRVHAFLVALGETGVVERGGEGDLELLGGIAASRLDAGSFSRGTAHPVHVGKTLAWDPRAEAAGPAFYFDERRVIVLR